MALVNCVIWLAVMFFGVHLENLAIEQAPETQPLQEQPPPTYGGVDADESLENRAL